MRVYLKARAPQSQPEDLTCGAEHPLSTVYIAHVYTRHMPHAGSCSGGKTSVGSGWHAHATSQVIEGRHSSSESKFYDLATSYWTWVKASRGGQVPVCSHPRAKLELITRNLNSSRVRDWFQFVRIGRSQTPMQTADYWMVT